MSQARGIIQHASQLAAKKELEWQEANKQRIDALQLALRDSELEAERQRSRYAQLQEDFKFNLKVLEERDAELERYDSVFAQMSAHLSGKDSEASELCIALDQLKQKLVRSEETTEELRSDLAGRLQYARQDAELVRAEKDKLLRGEREQFEKHKRDYQLTLSRMEEDASQREREIISAFEEALAKREHEFRMEQDSLTSCLHGRELQLRTASSELEKLQGAQGKCEAECGKLDDARKTLEKEVRNLSWLKDDEKAVNEAKISQLTGELSAARQEVDCLRKSAEDHRQRYHVAQQEKETALLAVRETNSEECRQYQVTVAELRAELENSQAECRRLQWGSEETGRQRAEDVTRLQRELAEQHAQLDQQVASVSRDKAARDLESRALRDQLQLAKAGQAQHGTELEKYKKELTAALDREASMQRSHDKEHLEWQQRLEVCEQQHHRRSEGIIESLMKARDEKSALAEQRLNELTQRDRVLRLLQASRAQALQLLEEHGLELPSGDAEILALSEEEQNMAELRAQNENLRTAIRLMREQMESVGQTNSDGNLDRDDGSHGDVRGGSSEYTVALEKDLADVKRSNRGLKIALDESQTAMATVKAECRAQAEAVRRCTGELSRLRAQLDESRQSLDRLVHDKSESLAALRQEQLRTAHLRHVLTQLDQKAGKQGSSALLQSAGSLAMMADLEGRLKAVQWRLTQVSAERDKLIQLSNRQRVAIRRLESSEAERAGYSGPEQRSPASPPAALHHVTVPTQATAGYRATPVFGAVSRHPAHGVSFDPAPPPPPAVSSRALREQLRQQASAVQDVHAALRCSDRQDPYRSHPRHIDTANAGALRSMADSAPRLSQQHGGMAAAASSPNTARRTTTSKLTKPSDPAQSSRIPVPVESKPAQSKASVSKRPTPASSKPRPQSHTARQQLQAHSIGRQEPSDSQLSQRRLESAGIASDGPYVSSVSAGVESPESMQQVWALLDRGFSELDSTH